METASPFHPEVNACGTRRAWAAGGGPPFCLWR